jgi:hypothetical protein
MERKSNRRATNKTRHAILIHDLIWSYILKAVVFIPGILGSSLVDPSTNQEIWPPTATEVLTGYRRIDQLIKNDLKVSGVIEKVCVPVYKPILDALKSSGISEDGKDYRLFTHAYDWRRDLNILADELRKSLDEIADLIGAEGSISLICHSMGGLIARAALESPTHSKRSGISAASAFLPPTSDASAASRDFQHAINCCRLPHLRSYGITTATSHSAHRT